MKFILLRSIASLFSLASLLAEGPPPLFSSSRHCHKGTIFPKLHCPRRERRRKTRLDFRPFPLSACSHLFFSPFPPTISHTNWPWKWVLMGYKRGVGRRERREEEARCFGLFHSGTNCRRHLYGVHNNLILIRIHSGRNLKSSQALQH